MKIKNLLLGMMACAAVAACSNEEIERTTTPNPGEKFEGDAYMSLNIAMVDEGTKAATAGDEDNGTAAETGISDIALLFYNGNALIQTVTAADLMALNGGAVDYSKALVVLKNPGVVPTSVVAVLNPSAVSFPATLSELKEKTNYALNGTADNKFTMTNSTFFQADNTIQMEVPVTPANVATSADAAKLSPVKIYVERTVAKVAPEVSGNLLINSGRPSIDGNPSAVVTVEIVGWGLSGTNKSSYVLKNLESSWNNLAWLKGTNRSFWAKDPNYAAASTTTEELNFITFPKTKPGTMYCLENTVDTYSASSNAATHLLVGAEIKVGGKAVTLYDYLGQKYTEVNVKTLMSTNANVSKYYVEDSSIDATEVGGKKYVSFKPGFLDLNEKGSSSYTVKATLTAAAKATKFYTLNSEKTVATEVPVAEVEAALAKLGDVSKYKDGKCYYYVAINHFGANGLGEVGVVRNHVYKMKINSITGLGTAVPNPDEVIIPEKPTTNDYYVAAKVEVLPWKGVNQDVDLK